MSSGMTTVYECVCACVRRYIRERVLRTCICMCARDLFEKSLLCVCKRRGYELELRSGGLCCGDNSPIMGTKCTQHK